MSFDWNDYLEIAKDLKTKTDGQAVSNSNEALQRTAISRAYYAMYHLALNYAKTKLGYVSPNQNGGNQFHSDIRSHYKKQMASSDYQEVGKILFLLHSSRVNSDYKADGIGNVKSLLSSSILQADKIKGILK